MAFAKLLYNPVAGRHRDLRLRTVRQITSALLAKGFQVEAEATHAKGSGAQQARDAIRRGATTIFACGGDGTVHDVLQGVAGTDTCLGIIPAGSANALAQELGFACDPVRAAQSLHPDVSRFLRTTLVQRPGLPALYSLCMAGAGPDGVLMYRMLAVNRAGLGRWRYYEHALRVFLSHRFETFHVQVQQPDGSTREHVVVSAMTLRIGDLQGIFRGIAAGASVDSEALHVVLVAPPARLTLPLWFLSAWLGLSRFHPGVTVSKASSVQTLDPVPLQVDGEWAGKVTATIRLDGPIQRVLVPASSLPSAPIH